MREIRRGVTEGIINNTGDVMPFMEDRITEMLVDQEDEITLHHPEVILVVGVNGVGKTTTIAKLANYYTKEGKKGKLLLQVIHSVPLRLINCLSGQIA